MGCKRTGVPSVWAIRRFFFQNSGFCLVFLLLQFFLQCGLLGKDRVVLALSERVLFSRGIFGNFAVRQQTKDMI